MTQALRLFGRVAADERRVFSLNAAVPGAIRGLSSATTGALVRRHQRLGAFFSEDLRGPLQAYLSAVDTVELDPLGGAEKGTDAAAGSAPNWNALYVAERLRGLGVSAEQVEELRRTRQIPIAVDIRSPTDGVVLARRVSVGQKFAAGEEWFRIADLDTVWVLADVIDGDAPLARPGAAVRVTLPGRSETFAGVVSDVPPVVDPVSRTLKVRLEVENPGTVLRPGMYVDVALPVTRPSAVTIPADALVDSGLRQTVFVETGGGVFEPREVSIGWRSRDRVEVVRGLAAGERVVISGAFLVDSESQLRAPTVGRPAPSPAVSPASSVVDPVCGMGVDEARAHAAGRIATHGERTYGFCSDSCKARFLAEPGRFAADVPHQADQAKDQP